MCTSRPSTLQVGCNSPKRGSFSLHDEPVGQSQSLNVHVAGLTHLSCFLIVASEQIPQRPKCGIKQPFAISVPVGASPLAFNLCEDGKTSIDNLAAYVLVINKNNKLVNNFILLNYLR